MARPAILALEDGSILHGVAFGYTGDSNHSSVYTVGEVVFNTAMTGYQEILTDPSYAEQLITFTYPHIGNVGINIEDDESDHLHAKGLIIRQLPKYSSHWRQQTTLASYLSRQKRMGIAEIDTRYLAHLLREKGAQKGCIYSAPDLTPKHIEEALMHARTFRGLQGIDLAKKLTTPSTYVWQEGGVWPYSNRVKKTDWHVVAYDFGIKKTILRCLHDLHCKLTVVPAKTSAEEVLALTPDGVFLSNGPGDPAACDYAILAIQTLLREAIPILGICLGHQLLALACQAKTVKMKCGHHGANHPVKALLDKHPSVLITSQNHQFTVSDDDFPACLEVTHRSLFDHTIQGIQHRTLPAFGFQGHPEAGPGPNDAKILFQYFIELMRQYRNHSFHLKHVQSQPALEIGE